MNIIGEKVVLRAIEATDCELLYDLINDSETEYLLGGWSFPVSKFGQDKWYQELSSNPRILRLIIDINGIAIGTVILSDIDYKNGSAEIQIKTIDGKYRGKGYGSDAVKSLVKYAFSELRLHCVYARINMHNNVSQKMFEGCGFIKEGVMRQRLYKRGNYVDVVMLSLLCDEVDA